MPKPRIFIVEDEAVVALEIEESLKSYGYEVVGRASTGLDAIRLITEDSADLVLMDISLNGELDGISTATIIHENYGIPIIFLTAYSQPDFLDRAKKVKPYGYIIKPYDHSSMKTTVEIALHKAAADAEIKRSQALYKAMFELNPLIIFTVNHDLLIENINSTVKNLLGYEESDLVGKPIYSLFGQDNAHQIKLLFQAHESVSSKAGYEFRVIKKDNSRLWVRLNFSTIYLNKNEFKINLVCENIDQNIRAQQEISYTNLMLQKVLSSLNEAVFILESTGFTISDCNTSVEEIFGHEKENLLNKKPDFIFESLDAFVAFRIKVETTFGSSDKFLHECVLKRKNGELFYAELFITVLREESKPIYVLVVRDIHKKIMDTQLLIETNNELKAKSLELKKSNYELDRTNKKLLESEIQLTELNKSKDKFFSIVAHDLKNPFQGLLGFSSILLEDLDKFSKEEIGYFVGKIKFLSENAFELLSNLLDWSRLQTDRISFNPGPVMLQKVIERSINIYSLNAIRKNIQFVNHIDSSLFVLADEQLLSSVMDNLIVNAVKFSHREGIIEIGVDDLGPNVIVWVKDYGVGISEADLEKIFKLDVHLTTLGTEQEAGTGLGLLLCREIIEKHGGKIWVESKLGEGTLFGFTLSKIAK